MAVQVKKNVVLNKYVFVYNQTNGRLLLFLKIQCKVVLIQSNF